MKKLLFPILLRVLLVVGVLFAGSLLANAEGDCEVCIPDNSGACTPIEETQFEEGWDDCHKVGGLCVHGGIPCAAG